MTCWPILNIARSWLSAGASDTGLPSPCRLLREEATIGVFFLSRDEVNPFNEKQIELVTTLPIRR